MSTFEIKTHQVGRTYAQPHFFILNKGLNAGKPMIEPCPNCFVISTQSKETKQTLFYICLALKTGRYFEYYLRGSVIPFITILDAKKLVIEAVNNNQNKQWERKAKKIQKIEALETNLKKQLKAIKQLKIAMLRS